ncbi:hypothetical protein VPH35_008144 [Triticum aestivum]|uniref:40S ribosomal protein S17 n=1 Tax=Triticum turgidum subsp. durum TaxID=4567 RepID=A0A9R0QSF1_TRITD|nr:unnamed protein product [Triticum turgidum subsp. durum]
MGRVRTKTVKKTSRQVIEKYYSRMTLDFHTNKKVLEEERERRMDFVPEKSALEVDEIRVDKETMDMLAFLGMADLPGVERAPEVTSSAAPYRQPFNGPRGGNRA